ncbi:hypothetical protein Psi01_67110 [Planobispora siamensis]|uniref:Uncharacterized protein n=1 Tax=Planobispora siamensis TaxID=936338 RepID=A0A8J3SP04_9ACTN|nr:hypothetical protein Psi01_67110 [Planobispora siamensis]
MPEASANRASSDTARRRRGRPADFEGDGFTTGSSVSDVIEWPIKPNLDDLRAHRRACGSSEGFTGRGDRDSEGFACRGGSGGRAGQA